MFNEFIPESCVIKFQHERVVIYKSHLLNFLDRFVVSLFSLYVLFDKKYLLVYTIHQISKGADNQRLFIFWEGQQ